MKNPRIRHGISLVFAPGLFFALCTLGAGQAHADTCWIDTPASIGGKTVKEAICIYHEPGYRAVKCGRELSEHCPWSLCFKNPPCRSPDSDRLLPRRYPDADHAGTGTHAGTTVTQTAPRMNPAMQNSQARQDDTAITTPVAGDRTNGSDANNPARQGPGATQDTARQQDTGATETASNGARPNGDNGRRQGGDNGGGDGGDNGDVGSSDNGGGGSGSASSSSSNGGLSSAAEQYLENRRKAEEASKKLNDSVSGSQTGSQPDSLGNLQSQYDEAAKNTYDGEKNANLAQARRDLDRIRKDQADLPGLTQKQNAARDAFNSNPNDQTYDAYAAAKKAVDDKNKDIKKDTDKFQKDLEQADKARERELARFESRTTEVNKGNAYQREIKTPEPSSGDRCAYSDSVDKKYRCNGTEKLIKAATISNQLTQAAGSVATQFAGQSNLKNASEQGTQAAALEAAGKTKITSGQIQMGVGALNAVMGVAQFVKASKHNSNAKEFAAIGKKSAVVSRTGMITDNNGVEQASQGEGNIDKTTGSVMQGSVQVKNELGKQIYDSYGFREAGTLVQDTGKFSANVRQIIDDQTMDGKQKEAALNALYAAAPEPTEFLDNEIKLAKALVKRRDDGATQKESHVNELIGKVSKQSQGEQKAMSSDAITSGFTSTVTGLQQSIMGFFSMKAGKEDLNSAKLLKNMNGTNPGLPVFDPRLVGDPTGGRPPTAITGSGENPTQQGAEEEEPEKGQGGDLGAPINPDGLSEDLPGGPMAGKFERAPGGGGSPAGAGGGLSNGGTAPANSTDSDESRSAAFAGNGPGYTGGGGTYMGGGKAGGGSDNGPDLTGLLAKFLPQKDEEKHTNGILDYGSRSPASEPYSFLDRGVNIFERVHQTYQDKHKSGEIGAR